jgi:hypothetical protein
LRQTTDYDVKWQIQDKGKDKNVKRLSVSVAMLVLVGSAVGLYAAEGFLGEHH